MKSTIRSLLSPWIPPAVRQLWQRPQRPGIDFHGQYASWERAVAASDGYDQGRILQKVKAATLKVERGEAAYERDAVVFDKVEIYWPVLAALLWAAARDGGRLSVLDFGGSLGTTYRQNRSFIDHLADVRWGVVEQPHYAASGREHFTTDRLSFHETIDECVAAIQPNVATFGAALQYVAEPYDILEKVAQSAATVLIVDRTPFSHVADDRITIQHVSPMIYEASYPSWIFSERHFRERVEKRWRVQSVHDCAEGTFATDGGLAFAFRGMILTR